MKLKSFSELGNLYTKIASTSEQNPVVLTENKKQTVLPTDVTQYLTEGLNKPGQAMGGGPGTEKKDGGVDVVPPQPKTGPQAAENFEEVDHKADPGSDAKVMKKEMNHEDPASENEHEDDAAKITTPKEKVAETEIGRAHV